MWFRGVCMCTVYFVPIAKNSCTYLRFYSVNDTDISIKVLNIAMIVCFLNQCLQVSPITERILILNAVPMCFYNKWQQIFYERCVSLNFITIVSYNLLFLKMKPWSTHRFFASLKYKCNFSWLLSPIWNEASVLSKLIAYFIKISFCWWLMHSPIVVCIHKPFIWTTFIQYLSMNADL